MTTPTASPYSAIADSVGKSIFSNGGKTLEKIVLYVVGVLTATNAIDPASISKNWILGSIAAILTGLHVSTPTPKSGPNQL